MARHRSELEVSMFPFLSVLCSIIGVLMLLMLTIMVTRVIEAEDVPPVAEPAGKRTGKRDSLDNERYEQLQAQLAELSGQLSRRRTERLQLERLQQQLVALHETKKDEFDFAPARRRRIDLDAPDPVRVVPDANLPVPKKPIFIEVTAEGYLVQPQKTRFAAVERRKDGSLVHLSDALTEFLDGVNHNRARDYLVLLIHPNGAEAFHALRFYLRKQKPEIDFGVEPFSNAWEFIQSDPQP